MQQAFTTCEPPFRPLRLTIFFFDLCKIKDRNMYKKSRKECKTKINILHANIVFGHILSVFTLVDPYSTYK